MNEFSKHIPTPEQYVMSILEDLEYSTDSIEIFISAMAKSSLYHDNREQESEA